MRNCIVSLSFVLITGFVLFIVLWGEYHFIYPLFGEEYFEWYIILSIITLFAIPISIGWIFSVFFHMGYTKVNANGNKYPEKEKSRNTKYYKPQPQKNNNPTPIIAKALGGYTREQLNEIFLIGILIHQIYMSDMRFNLSERQQRKSLSIQMRFFVTVFPQRNVAEYFDFSEQFISKNEHLASLSLDKCIALSAQRLSDCNNKQIEKLCNLFKTLGNAYKEQVGGGNPKMMTAFLNLLDSELSNLKSEEDWRDSYAKKKSH